MLDSSPYQDIRVDSNERLALYDEEHTSGLPIRCLMIVYGGLLLSLLICMPKIWLSNSIYYISRDINKLQTQNDLLKEENKRLQNERESLRYQYLKAQTAPHNPSPKGL